MSLDHLNLTPKSCYLDINAKKCDICIFNVRNKDVVVVVVVVETLLISFPFLLYSGKFKMSRWRRKQERQTNKQTEQ